MLDSSKELEAHFLMVQLIFECRDCVIALYLVLFRAQEYLNVDSLVIERIRDLGVVR